MKEMYSLIMQFYIYAFMGWIFESIFKSIKFKTPINSGFLKGPFVPVYGFGALIIILLEHSFLAKYNLGTRLLIYTCTASVLEYYTGALLEELFQLKLWDYSDLPLNIKGRICLLHSFFWTLLSYLMLAYFQPEVTQLLEAVPARYYALIGSLLLLYTALDFGYSSVLWKLEQSESQATAGQFPKSLGFIPEINNRLLTVLPEIHKKMQYTINVQLKEYAESVRKKLNDL